MRNVSLSLLIFVLLITGCAGQRFKSDLNNAIKPADLRSQFNTQPINLKDISKCSSYTIKLVNDEKIDKDINAVPGAIFSPNWNINPRELADQIIKYLDTSFRQCRIQTSPESNKILKVSIKEITGWPSGFARFVSYSHLQIDINIPEINFIETFTSDQSSPYLHDAMAQSIHLIAWQIINDPIIQDYITCK